MIVGPIGGDWGVILIDSAVQAPFRDRFLT